MKSTGFGVKAPRGGGADTFEMVLYYRVGASSDYGRGEVHACRLIDSSVHAYQVGQPVIVVLTCQLKPILLKQDPSLVSCLNDS